MTDLTGDAERPVFRRALTQGSTGYWLRLSAARIAVLLVTLGIWQFASGHLIDPFWVSSPAAIIGRLLTWLPTEIFWLHLQVTLIETVVGFIAGTACGVALGLALGMNRYVADVLDPFIIALYSLPKVALAPLFIRLRDDRRLFNRWMAVNGIFHFDGGDIFTAGNDDIFRAVLNLDIAIGMPYR